MPEYFNPTPEEMEKVRLYMQTLNSYKLKPAEMPDEEFLVSISKMILGLIEKFGKGNVRAAARKHAKLMLELYLPPSKDDTIH